MLISPFQQRRQNRQRRDYLYRRALLLRDAEISEKRAKLREALATGKPLDRAIANDEQLRKDLQYDETAPGLKEQLDLDDECTFQSSLFSAKVYHFANHDRMTSSLVLAIRFEEDYSGGP